MERRPEPYFEFGPFCLAPDEARLLRDNEAVPLTPKAFDLLLALVSNPRRLLTKQELLEMVWPDSFVEEANLSVKMSELRRALGESPSETQYIETVPRRGYRFIAEVKTVFEEFAEIPVAGLDAAMVESKSDLQPPDIGNPPAAPSDRISLRRWLIVFSAVIIVLAAFLGFNVGGLRERFFGKGVAGGIHSIAVLPMANLSGDPGEDYFAEGMTETLIAGLAKVGALRVISRTSVMQYKSPQKAVPEIGRELSVDAIVEGSVQRFGDRVKITVQLIDAQSDRHLWTETYDRDLRDILILQNEVARAVTQAIEVKLTPQEQTRLAKAGPIDPAAYDYFLRGRYYFGRQTKHDNEVAIDMFDRAVAADPGFAAAHAALAQACVWRFFLFTPDEKQWEEKAFIAVEKALSLDPDLAEAHLARGRLLWTPSNHFPHEEAIREYHRALDANPNLDEARNQLAVVYGHIGLLDEALQELQKAVSINPSNTVARYRVGEILLFKGNYEGALAAFRSVPSDANPALIGHQTAWALFNVGRKDQAASTLEQFLTEYPEDNGGLYTSVQAVIAASNGRESETLEKINLALEKGKGFGHFHHTAYHIACAFALLNNHEMAMKWLESAASDGFPCYPLFEIDRNLDTLRQDPKFISFLSEQRKQWEGRRGL